jgi:hypothetical protein
MATDPFELYPLIAQIAGAFAGFGSLASGLGQRRGGDDSRMDAYRLEHMLQASLSATLFGLLPATLAGLSDESWGLQLSALIASVAILVYAPLAVARARGIKHVAGFSIRATIINSACVWTAFIAFALCAIGIPAGRAANLYLLGLMGLLGSSVMLFSRVIVSMLRPHHKVEG